jgi:hypothetical protein
LDRRAASLERDLLALDSVDAGERMLFVERALQFPDRLGFSLQLRLHRAVGLISHESTDLEWTRQVPNELAKTDSLHPAAESEAHPDVGHAGVPSDVK